MTNLFLSPINIFSGSTSTLYLNAQWYFKFNTVKTDFKLPSVLTILPLLLTFPSQVTRPTAWGHLQFFFTLHVNDLNLLILTFKHLLNLYLLCPVLSFSLSCTRVISPKSRCDHVFPMLDSPKDSALPTG